MYGYEFLKKILGYVYLWCDIHVGKYRGIQRYFVMCLGILWYCVHVLFCKFGFVWYVGYKWENLHEPIQQGTILKLEPKNKISIGTSEGQKEVKTRMENY